MGLKEIGWKNMDSTDVAQAVKKWQAQLKKQ